MAVWKEPTRLKLVLIGDSGVGKSSLTHTYAKHVFPTSQRATIAVDFVTKEVDINGTTVILEMWDTAGTERFRSQGTFVYRWAHCCVLVFDVTSGASFRALAAWREEFLDQGHPPEPSHFPFVVVGNKTDADNREVSREQTLQWCEEIGAQYHETSAKQDLHVENAFLDAARAALQQVCSTSQDLTCW